MRTLSVTTLPLGSWHVVVWLHTTADPRRDEFEHGLELSMRLKQSLGGSIASMRSFVVTDGGAPDSGQRKRMADTIFDGRPHKLAVVTNSLDNPVKRGVATALSWLNPAFLAVQVDRWREALQHVDLNDHRVPLLRTLNELQSDLPPVETLAQLSAAVQRAADSPARIPEPRS